MKILCVFLVFSMFSLVHAADGRYGTARIGSLALDGMPVALLKDASGGAPYGDVVLEPNPNEAIVKKHIGNVRYDDLTLKVGLGMDPILSNWMQEAGTHPTKKSGSIGECDMNNVSVSQKDFQDALLTEITFPTLDAASKEPGFITLKLTPEQVRTVPARNKCQTLRQKPWITANFKLEIAGLDTTRVSKIESFGIKLKVTSNGSGRDRMNEPGRPDFSNLRITISNASAKAWQEWNDSVLVQGNVGDQFEKSGSIILLGPDLKELARVNLENIGIIKMSSSTNPGNELTLTVVDLYVEKMEFIAVK